MPEGTDRTTEGAPFVRILESGALPMVVFTLACVWLAMLLAFQQPYSYTLDVSKAHPGETTGFSPIKDLGQPGYLWGSQYASLDLASPGSPSQITIRLGGRSDGAVIPFTLNQKPLGSVTLPGDGSMITHTFTLPASLISRDDLHLGIVAPVLKANNQRLSVQVDTATIISNPSLDLAWPPTGAALVATLAALLLAMLGWQLHSPGRWFVPVMGAIALYLLMVGRANIIVPLLLFCAALLLLLVAVSGVWRVLRVRRAWLPDLRSGLIPISFKRLPSLVLANGPETMPLFRVALIFVILLQIPLYGRMMDSAEVPINFYYFVGLLLVAVAFVLRGRYITLALVGAMVVAGVLLRLYWANLPTTSDVYWANTQACYFILHGRNPYAEIFTWVPGGQVYPWYGYFPFTIFSQLPFYLLGDVRWGLGLYDLATIALLYLMLRRRWGSEIGLAVASLLLLYVPFSDLTIFPGIVDPVMVFWLALSFYLLTKEQWMWAAVAGGLALASKQYAVFYVLALLAFFVKQRRWREAAILVVVPAIIIVPFFLWSPADFIGDTIQLHLSWYPEPTPGSWNVSIWAQGVGVFNGGAPAAVALKPVASIIELLILIAVAIVNLLRPTLPQVIGTTTVLMAIAFGLNSNNTQYFYWRDVALLLIIWAAVWQPASGLQPTTELSVPNEPAPALLPEKQAAQVALSAE